MGVVTIGELRSGLSAPAYKEVQLPVPVLLPFFLLLHSWKNEAFPSSLLLFYFIFFRIFIFSIIVDLHVLCFFRSIKQGPD